MTYEVAALGEYGIGGQAGSKHLLGPESAQPPLAAAALCRRAN